MSFPATSPTKETPGVTFSVTSRRSLDCGRPTTGSDEGNSSRDFEMNRLAVHHSHYRAPTISGNFTGQIQNDATALPISRIMIKLSVLPKQSSDADAE